MIWLVGVRGSVFDETNVVVNVDLFALSGGLRGTGRITDELKVQGGLSGVRGRAGVAEDVIEVDASVRRADMSIRKNTSRSDGRPEYVDIERRLRASARLPLTRASAQCW